MSIKRVKDYIYKKRYHPEGELIPSTPQYYSYTGSKVSTTLGPGTYKLQVWGAGPKDAAYSTARAGYSEGILTLTESTDIFIYVGGQATSSAGGFNGGGKASGGGVSGSGATDIRIGTDSLYARVIVAGGVGGKGDYSSTSTYTYYGHGGGEYSQGNVITQTSGYSFGTGQVGSSGSGGGGGGWYGGSANRMNGYGGTGYVYTSYTAGCYPSGCRLNSSYFLKEAKTISGSSTMPSISGSTETGHSGNGYCIITEYIVREDYEEDEASVMTKSKYIIKDGKAKKVITYKKEGDR